MRTVVLFVYGLSALCAAENVIKTKPGDTATFKCGLKASSSVLKWQRGSDVLFTTNPKTGMPLRGKVEIVTRSQLKYERELIISQIKMEDAGPFTCTANWQQELHRLVVASVSSSGSFVAGSSAVLQCDVAGLNPGSVAQWVRPDGIQTPSHRVELNPIASSDAGEWKCVYSVDGKTMSEALNIQVTAPGPKTTAAQLTTRMPQHQRPTGDMSACLDCSNSSTSVTPTLAGLSWWMWAAVVGGCLVIVLLWVLVLVLYNRMTRRKKRFMKMKKLAQLKTKQYCQCPCPAAAPGGRREPSAPLLLPRSVQCH